MYKPLSNRLWWREWTLRSYPMRKAKMQKLYGKHKFVAETVIGRALSPKEIFEFFPFKYTFQDWLNERFPLEPIVIYTEVLNISPEDWDEILNYRINAAQKRLYDAVEYLKYMFGLGINYSLLPNEWIDNSIYVTKSKIEEIERTGQAPALFESNFIFLSAGITAKQAKWYFSVNIRECCTLTASEEAVAESLALNEETEENSPFSYITYKICLRWLNSLKRQEEINPTLPSLPDPLPVNITSSQEPGTLQVAYEPSQPDQVPVVKPEEVMNVFNVMKDCFNPNQHAALMELLQTGYTASGPLLFMNQGKILTEALKELYENNYIIGIQLKRDLHKWIVEHFRFLDKNGDKQKFKTDTVHQYVSTNKSPCKNPLFKIKAGKIVRSDANQ